MQKILLRISFLTFLSLTHLNILYSQDNTLYLSDSLGKNVVEYYHANDTDVLQEDLYHRLVSRIENHTSINENPIPTTRFQFFQNSLKYYPEATLKGEMFIIPYPQGKFKNFKEMRYHIPSDFFKDNYPESSLQPEITLQKSTEKSTLIFNNAYTLVFYRSPGIKSDALLKSTQAIQKIYNLILPGSQKSEPDKSFYIKGTLFFKGYQPHTITFTTLSQLRLFLDELTVEGSLYFYPSRIEIHQKTIIINGLLYVIKDNILNIYHFAEIDIIFTNTSTPDYSEFKMTFYPYIKNLRAINE